MSGDRPVLIVGSGLGGLSAALRLAERGRSVMLIEAGDKVGGTVAFSGGGIHIWGARNWDEYRPHSPLSDPVLGEALASNFEHYVAWLAASGAPGRYESTVVRGLSLLKYQIGRSIAPHERRAWLDFIADRIRALGGRICLGTRAVGVERTSDGPFRLTLDNGETVTGSALILAAGGFQADPERLLRHAGINPALLVQRSVAENRGDGLSLALAAGAAPTARMDTVYGHLMPAAPCRIDWTNPIMPLVISAFYAEHGLLIDASGRRFVDEGAGELTGLTINAAAHRSSALWVILDERIRTGPARYTIPREMLVPGSLRYWRLLRYLRPGLSHEGFDPWVDTIALARDRGAHILTAGTLDELAILLAREGVDGDGLRTTLFSGRFDPPKTKAAHPIATPPFMAIRVGVGVSMTYGGVAIDASARALDAQGDPVPGLFAVPGTAGGVNYLHYAGALAACGVFGMIAAETVLSE